MNQQLLQLKLKERLLTDELEQLWEELAGVAEVPEMPLTYQQAVNQLKVMILDGQGTWLASDVERVGDKLQTSAEALRHASTETGLSLHLLKGSLHRPQRSPLLRQEGDTLVLHLD